MTMQLAFSVSISPIVVLIARKIWRATELLLSYISTIPVGTFRLAFLLDPRNDVLDEFARLVCRCTIEKAG